MSLILSGYDENSRIFTYLFCYLDFPQLQRQKINRSNQTCIGFKFQLDLISTFLIEKKNTGAGILNSKKSSKNIYALVTRLEVKVQTHIKDRWGFEGFLF